MYCQSCGAEVKDGLRYCNRCGANLAPPQARVSPENLRKLIWALVGAIAVAVIIGFIAIFFIGIEVMSRGNVSSDAYTFLLLFTLVVFAVVALLVWQLSRLITAYLQNGDAPKPKTQSSIAETKHPQLSEPAPFDTIPLGQKQTSPVEAEQRTRKFE